MSLFGALMADVEDDSFYGSHMRHMREMNNFMMNPIFTDPLGLLGGPRGGQVSLAGHNNIMPMTAMMPFMPQMPMFGGLEGGHCHDLDVRIGGPPGAASYSSSTVVMSSGPNGNPQVFSSTSSTKIGANGIKETRKTLQDSRTGTKKMSIGHHIGQRAHVIEREQNVFTGDAEENQEFINLEEDEAEDFDREFQMKAGASLPHSAITSSRREPARLALPAPPPPTSSHSERRYRPSARRPIRASASPLATNSATVREVYSAPHPQRRHKHANKNHRQTD